MIRTWFVRFRHAAGAQVALLVIAIAAGYGGAQEGASTVAGQVSDPSRATIVSGTSVALNVGTVWVRSTRSNDSDAYATPTLEGRSPSITIEFQKGSLAKYAFRTSADHAYLFNAPVWGGGREGHCHRKGSVALDRKKTYMRGFASYG